MIPRYLLSVIIPVYNRAWCLDRCVTSVIGAADEQVEIILIDDYSSDDSPQICKYYAANHANIIFRPLNQNRGAGEARNVGIEIAQGKYTVFLDSDDEFDNILGLLDLLRKNPNIDICIGHSVSLRPDGSWYERKSHNFADERILTAEELFASDIQLLPEILFVIRTCILRPLAFLNLKFAEESFLMVRAVLNSMYILFTPMTLRKIYIHTNSSITANIYNDSLYNDLINAFSPIAEFAVDEPNYARRRFISDVYRHMLPLFAATAPYDALKSKKSNIPLEKEVIDWHDAFTLKLTNCIQDKLYFAPANASNILLANSLMETNAILVDAFLDNGAKSVSRNSIKAEEFGYCVLHPNAVANETAVIVIYSTTFYVQASLRTQFLRMGYYVTYDNQVIIMTRACSHCENQPKYDISTT